MLALQTKPKTRTMVRSEAKPFELIIIGGGPAGLTAGIYAKRARIDTLLIEKALTGGLITSTVMVENYPGFPDGITGMELGERLSEQAKNNKLDIVYGTVNKIEANEKMISITTNDASYTTKALIVATGSNPKKLDVPGEKELIGKGVSYCATCDGPFYKDKNVALVGGGNSAIEEALFLTKYAKLVTIIHRRDELRADKVLEEKANNNPKIFFRLSSVVEEIVGTKKVTSLKLKDVKTNKRSVIDVDGIFIYVGYTPNTGLVKGIVEMDENGSILTDEKLMTNVKGIFAAGDVRKKSLKQVVTAVADGAIAANSVKEYLEKD